MAGAGGNNCAAGAAAGVIGESVGSAVYQNGNGLSRESTIAVSKIVGAFVAAGIAGPNDGNSVFAGGNIGYNAAANNAVMRVIFGKAEEEKFDNNLKTIKTNLGESLADRFVASNDTLEKAALYPLIVASTYIPESATEIEIGIATGGLSKAYATEIGALFNKADDWLNGLIGRSGSKIKSSINITEDGLSHTLDRHTVNEISRWENKSKFYDTSEISNLISNANYYSPTQQSNGNLARIIEANKIIGFDKLTQKPTSTYTVITNSEGNLITAFPGKPYGY